MIQGLLSAPIGSFLKTAIILEKEISSIAVTIRMPNFVNTYTTSSPAYAAADDAICSDASIPTIFCVLDGTPLSITFTVSLATNKVILFWTVA
jgi:hypothetical protein